MMIIIIMLVILTVIMITIMMEALHFEGGSELPYAEGLGAHLI